MTSTALAQQPNIEGRRYSPDLVRSVAPELERVTQDRLFGTIWNRPGLDRRDRSLVTISALIARGQMSEISYYVDQAIENGVKPQEISETITHLAYYAGWGNAMAAIGPVGKVFTRRGISASLLSNEDVAPLAIDEAAEADRAARVSEVTRGVAPALADYTTDYLFRDLWLRPGLAPRDRSLITVAALISSGQVAQITYHLNRAMDNGLTEQQAGEVITHIAFYAGWPNAMSALAVAKSVFEKRKAG